MNEPISEKLYKALWLLFKNEELKIVSDSGLGYFNHVLELLFGNCLTYRLHATFYTCFARLYEDTELGPGYTYAIHNSRFRNSKLFGHIMGLLFCFWYGKDVGRIFANRYCKYSKLTEYK